MSKIVYLFGAGASYGTLPMVSEMPDWLEVFIDDISRQEFLLSDRDSFEQPDYLTGQSKQYYQTLFIEDLKWLKQECLNHISIDTFAKKLSIRADTASIRRLKIILSAYFVAEQIRHKPNKRYDFFFASVMERLFKFPDDIRILSWNYDTQFEIAFSEFSENDNIRDNQNVLNVHVKNNQIEASERETFGIYKLNGSTELFSMYSINPTRYYFNKVAHREFNTDTLEDLIHNYAAIKFSNTIIPGFSFAWESSNHNSFFDNVLEDTKDCEVMVVIGYSFPFFNREIDQEIIMNMQNLKKVYFQDPEVEVVMRRFKSIRRGTISPKLIAEEATRYFYVPDELSR